MDITQRNTLLVEASYTKPDVFKTVVLVARDFLKLPFRIFYNLSHDIR